MPSINPFQSNPAFSMASLTASINLLPNMYGRINQMGLFGDQGVTTRTIWVEEQNGVLALLPSQPVGSPGTLGKDGKRKARAFVIPHFPHDNVVLPDEVQNVRAFGSENNLDVLSRIVNNKLQTMKNKHDITLEYMRMGALKGTIVDGGGVTLYNLFTEFGITQKVIAMALTTSTTEVRNKCLDISRWMEDNLMGEVMSQAYALCSQTFFDALISHANVKAAYANYAEAANRLGGDPRKGFQFGGVTFEEYRASAADSAGVTQKFIPDDEAYCFPLGTMETFRTYFAPADFNETANTIGLPYYSKQEPRRFDRGTDLHSQSNPLPLCLRPGVLVKLTKV